MEENTSLFFNPFDYNEEKLMPNNVYPPEWFIPLPHNDTEDCKNISKCTKFEIFIDGSTTDQAKTFRSKHLRRGGIGFYHPASNTKLARPFLLPNPTNNRCEYFASIFALEWVLTVTKNMTMEEQAKIEVILYSDSQLLINSMTKWITAWKRKGWKKADGKPVKNKGILEKIDDIITNSLPKTRFVKVKAHKRKPDGKDKYELWLWTGNFIADKMANDGRAMAEKMSPT